MGTRMRCIAPFRTWAWIFVAILVSGLVGFQAGALACTGAGCEQGCFHAEWYHTTDPMGPHKFAAWFEPALFGCSSSKELGITMGSQENRIYPVEFWNVVCPRNTTVWYGEDSSGTGLGISSYVYLPTECVNSGS